MKLRSCPGLIQPPLALNVYRPLKRALRFDGSAVCFVRGDGPQRASHVRVENLEAVHVAGVDPTEPARVYVSGL